MTSPSVTETVRNGHHITTTTHHRRHAMRELDYREANGGSLQVSLDFDTASQQLLLTVVDRGTSTQCEVPSNEARFAFEHPFAWMGGFGAKR